LPETNITDRVGKGITEQARHGPSRSASFRAGETRSGVTTSQIEALPPELLLCILRYVNADTKRDISDNTQHDYFYMASCSLVSRLWHDLTLVPGLWTNIHIPFHLPTLIATYLEVYLQRAAGCDLHLFFHLWLGTKRHASKFYITALSDVLAILSSHTHKVETITIIYTETETSSGLLTDIMNSILVQPSSNYSCLRKMEIYYRGFTGWESPSVAIYPESLLGKRTFGTQFELRLQFVTVSAPLCGMTVLDLHGVGGLDPFFAAIAKNCPTLERLTIRKMLAIPRNAQDIRIPHSQFPSLRHLAVSNSSLSPGSSQTLEHFLAPKLETLELEGNHLSQIRLFNQSEPLHYLTRVRLTRFSLHKPRRSPDYWATQWPNLEEVHLIDTDCESTLPSDKVQSAIVSSRQFQWPNLKRITLDTNDKNNLLWLQRLVLCRANQASRGRQEVSTIEEIRMSDRTRRLMEEYGMDLASFREVRDDAGKDADSPDVGDDGQYQGDRRGTSILHWSPNDDDNCWIDWDDSHVI
jgi:Leucine-rich repeat (LRR) protein